MFSGYIQICFKVGYTCIETFKNEEDGLMIKHPFNKGIFIHFDPTKYENFCCDENLKKLKSGRRDIDKFYSENLKDYFNEQ